MGKEREHHFDLLRAFSIVSVVIIHVSGVWVDGFTAFVSQGGSAADLVHPAIACLYNTLTRFAVPCFLMLSGAFLLANERNAEYGYFYARSFERIGIPALLFTLLYTLYRLPFCFVGEKQGTEELWQLAREVLSGHLMGHMWYLYMLLGVYLLVPVILQFKRTVSESVFCVVAAVFLTAACLSSWTTENVQLSWNIGQSFEYTAYLLIGYVLRKNVRKNPAAGMALIGIGVMITLGIAYVEYSYRICGTMAVSRSLMTLRDPLSPAMVLASVLIFAGFSMLTVPGWKVVALMSEHSLALYLIHQGVLDFICKLLHFGIGQDFYMKLDCAVWIPALTLVTLAGTALLTVVYNKVYSRLLLGYRQRKTV